MVKPHMGHPLLDRNIMKTNNIYAIKEVKPLNLKKVRKTTYIYMKC